MSLCCRRRVDSGYMVFAVDVAEIVADVERWNDETRGLNWEQMGIERILIDEYFNRKRSKCCARPMPS
jgi:hypothetical protein